MISVWLPCTSSSAARRSTALDSCIRRLLRRVHAADSYEHHAVHNVVSAITTATTGSIHLFVEDSGGFSDIELNQFSWASAVPITAHSITSRYPTASNVGPMNTPIRPN